VVGGDDWFTGLCGLDSNMPPGQTTGVGNPRDTVRADTVTMAGLYMRLLDGHAKWFKSPGDSWRTPSSTGVAYLKTVTPNASAWFRED